MPKTRQQKEVLLQKVVDQLKTSKAAAFSDATGLKVLESQELKKQCKAEKVEAFSIKKTLLKKALKDSGFEAGDLNLDGSLFVAFSVDNELAPAKILNEFSKNHEKLQFRAGLLEGKLLSIEELKALANLPSKEQLYGKFLATIKGPISGFVHVLAGNLRGLVRVLSAIKDTKQA